MIPKEKYEAPFSVVLSPNVVLRPYLVAVVKKKKEKEKT